MFNPTAVIFKDGKKIYQVNYRNPEQAEFVAELAARDLRGDVEVSKCAASDKTCLDQFHDRLKTAERRFSELVSSRTGALLLQEKTAALLMQWFIHGKN